MLHGSFWHQNAPYLIYKEIQQYLKYDLSLKVSQLLTLGHQIIKLCHRHRRSTLE